MRGGEHSIQQQQQQQQNAIRFIHTAGLIFLHTMRFVYGLQSVYVLMCV